MIDAIVSEKLKLMVVDDEADNLDLLYRTFRRDFIVFKANSAAGALQILEQEGEMGIIISDQRMPGMNGTEFLSRTVERFPDTIRILLTGYTDVEDLVGAINAGKVFKYITKPWNPKDLKTVVLQAAETYRVVKQRTNELHRALRRESIFNAVTTAIRESLDYRNMLQTVVTTIGQTFAADHCVLRPVASGGVSGCHYQILLETFSFVASTLAPPDQQLDISTIPELDPTQLNRLLVERSIQLIPTNVDCAHTRLIVPLTYQQELLAVLVLCKHGSDHPWMPDEIQLIEEVAGQAALALSQAKLYQRIQEQTEQMRAELAVARQIQMNLLRQQPPQLESVKIQAHCLPAREVGGDFFEIYVHPQGDIWLAVGDVSGKGVPAALFMASAVSLLRRELAHEISPEPEQVMKNLNASLSEDLVSSNCFITIVLARYTPATYELVYANAGHIYPMVWSHRQKRVALPKSGKPEQTSWPKSGSPNPCEGIPTYLQVRGVPLGILPTWKAPAERLTLKPGDVLLLTSDGITEATVGNGSAEPATESSSMLRQIGLWQLLLQQPGDLNLKDLLDTLQSRTQVQEDDQTILALEVL
ncbi:MAG: SpoIIE family protein phosphatase [Synechococcales cyanobacterium C42_A2020_086]|jgi:serine phosphatase RsbU (regulator of sigma subunit)/CheY-like chemotaxis protein|nr:SpoIIE family protein phosphatase [Synechococcales cyanobacterium C42_A2020_086]